MKNSDKVIIEFCGGSGSWGNPYREAGYTVVNLTLPEYDICFCKYYHTYLMILNEKSRKVLKIKYHKIYGVLAAPPCTKFSKANWRVKKEDRDFKEGMKTVRACMDIIWTIQEHGAPLKFWALENPMGYLYNFMGRHVFYFQPWQFGETGFLATKRTALWGYFNPPAKTVKKRPSSIKFISAHNQSNGQRPVNREWNSFSHKDRAAQRSITPPGFANAFFKANR